MMNETPIFKDGSGQRPIPSAWRNTIVSIVEAFKDEDVKSLAALDEVCPISEGCAGRIAGNIEDYGATLVSLPEGAWETSACQWMDGYWDALIDLFTAEEGRSDLALALRVFEDGSGFRFQIESIHVP